MSYGPNCGRCKKPKTTKRRRFKYCFACNIAVKRESKERSHEVRVCDTYGLLPGDYEKLYKAMGSKCPVPGCRATGKTKRLAVEHDHKLGLNNRAAVRGLMCSMHNDMLGKAGDNPVVFEWLAEYLRNPPARKVLRD
jgi:hypothetical protein